MIVKIYDGSEININLKKYLLKETYQRSKFQTRIKEQLKEEYPSDNIYEEVYIPIEKFYLDLFIPSRQLVIEIQGKQHSMHIKFFHKTKIDFNNQKNRDERKINFCLLNNFKFVAVYDK